MQLIYGFDIDTPKELLAILARNLQQRRLEKGLSREALSELSVVGTSVEENRAFVALAKALGYGNDIKKLLSEPQYSTMEELDRINRNKNRKRGRNEISQ